MSLRDEIDALIASKNVRGDVDVIEQVGMIQGILDCAQLLVPRGLLTQAEYNEIEDGGASLVESLDC
jgi:hypothetical protein